jgi:hypothetical protein
MATLRDEEGGEVNRARHAPSEQRRLAPDCYIPLYAHGDDSFLAQLACRETSRLKGVLHFMAEGNSAEGPDGRSEAGRRRMEQAPRSTGGFWTDKASRHRKSPPFGEPGSPFIHQSLQPPLYKMSPRCQIKRESRSCNASRDILWFRGGARLSRAFPRARALRGGFSRPSSRGVQKKLVVRSGGVGETAVTVGRPP